MDLQLQGKTALVLGAGGGLGSAIARTLASEGCRVAAADIKLEAAQNTVDAIVDAGGQAIALEWDLGNLSLIDPLVTRIETELGGVDVLINNTGGPPPTTAHAQSPVVWMSHFQSMVLSVIAITDRVLPGMRKRSFGRIITSTSSGVLAPIANLGISNALRMSLVGWSKTLAGEVGGDGVTANIVLPGRIGTARIQSLDAAKAEREGRRVEDVARESAASIPVKRYGDPQEYADAVTFLASPRSGYITGSVIRIDGGLIAGV
jgi:3-oxoacyl-[acyl-carrier protein] reductase